MTFSTLRAASASRSAAASTGSVQVTPVDRSWYPLSAAPSWVPRIAETTWSDALTVGASAVLTAKPSSSTVTPSAFSPSTRTMRTAVGAIDTPSTVSTTPPKLFARGPGLPETDHPSQSFADCRDPQILAGVTRVTAPVFATSTLPMAGPGGYALITQCPHLPTAVAKASVTTPETMA